MFFKFSPHKLPLCSYIKFFFRANLSFVILHYLVNLLKLLISHIEYEDPVKPKECQK